MPFDGDIRDHVRADLAALASTSQTALACYGLAKENGGAVLYERAAHALARALETELARAADRRKPAPIATILPPIRAWVARNGETWRWGYEGGAFQFSGFSDRDAALAHALKCHDGYQTLQLVAEPAPSPVISEDPPRSRTRKAVASVDDLAAPMGAIPKAKRATGSFVCTWSDGSETRVAAVVYRGDKPATRWAAAFQAADRLRRLRMRHAYADKLGNPAGRWLSAACDVQVETAQWWELVATSPMPALFCIADAAGEMYEAPDGSGFGAGDRTRAAELEAKVSERVNPLRAPAFEIPTAPFVPLATARAGGSCVGLRARDIDGADVVIDPAALAIAIERAGEPVSEASALADLAGDTLKAAKTAADAGGADSSLWAAYCTAKAESEAARHDLNAAKVKAASFTGGLEKLRPYAGDTRWTVKRLTGGFHVRLSRSDGREMIIRAGLIDALRLAAPDLQVAA